MSIEITGINEMLAKIEKLGKNVEKIKKKALSKGAEVLKTEISQNAVRSSTHAKHLADNIEISDVKVGSDGLEYLLVGPTKEYFYGKFLEFGTVKMRARPFMEPALLSKKQEVLEKIAEEIRSELNV